MSGDRVVLPLLSCPCGGTVVAELYRPRRGATTARPYAFVGVCPRCSTALVDLPERPPYTVRPTEETRPCSFAEHH